VEGVAEAIETAIKGRGRLAFTIPQAVQAGLGGQSTIYQLIAEGKLRAVKRGRSTLILADDLLAFLRSLPAIESKKPSRYSEGARRARQAQMRKRPRRA
jgi:excisionase family DNA binding protein